EIEILDFTQIISLFIYFGGKFMVIGRKTTDSSIPKILICGDNLLYLLPDLDRGGGGGGGGGIPDDELMNGLLALHAFFIEMITVRKSIEKRGFLRLLDIVFPLVYRLIELLFIIIVDTLLAIHCFHLSQDIG
ncbi:hypothetical protein ACJX0J_007019, partial [Zea mays]